jgi:hypothetical protein
MTSANCCATIASAVAWPSGRLNAITPPKADVGSVRYACWYSGRRADLVALGDGGEIWIVEIKSCIADFRTDRKWQEYRLYCDRLLFAVAPDFPAPILPSDAGVMIADAYGGTLVREAPLHGLAASRRKAMLIRFGRAAAGRLSARVDPGLSEGLV